MSIPSGDEVRIHGAIRRLGRTTPDEIADFLMDVPAERVREICDERGWRYATK